MIKYETDRGNRRLCGRRRRSFGLDRGNRQAYREPIEAAATERGQAWAATLGTALQVAHFKAVSKRENEKKSPIFSLLRDQRATVRLQPDCPLRNGLPRPPGPELSIGGKTSPIPHRPDLGQKASGGKQRQSQTLRVVSRSGPHPTRRAERLPSILFPTGTHTTCTRTTCTHTN